MVSVLAIDVGSSSVKAAVLAGTRPTSPLVRQPFATRYDGVRAEVDARSILSAVSRAARAAVAGNVGKPVDVVALSAMSPSWVAMDKTGKPLTPVVTHQDRRSLAEARRIEAAVGRVEHLDLTGNRPVPGGISSTTAAWFTKHEKSLMRRADLVGHVQTLLLRTLTGARAMDPGNASFTGLYTTTYADLTDPASGWDDALIDAAGLRRSQLPAVLPGDSVAGDLHAAGARALGLRRGTPVLTGVVDTSAAILLGGARPGMLFNVCGSTDVLAVVTDEPAPDERYLTRHLGVGERWLAVCTIPSAGSAIVWAKSVLYPDMNEAVFFKHVMTLAKAGPRSAVTFEPHLAGSRTSVEQPAGAWHGLRLSTTREEMLAAVIDALAKASADRIELLRCAAPRFHRDVLRTGGTGKVLASVLYRDWPGKWAFADIEEATVLGLGQLATGHPV